MTKSTKLAKRYMPQTFHPFLPKKAKTISTAQRMKAENVLVIITATWLNQLAKAIWNIMATIRPPKMAAVILANRCEKDGVKYFLLAGIG